MHHNHYFTGYRSWIQVKTMMVKLMTLTDANLPWPCVHRTGELQSQIITHHISECLWNSVSTGIRSWESSLEELSLHGPVNGGLLWSRTLSALLRDGSLSIQLFRHISAVLQGIYLQWDKTVIWHTWIWIKNKSKWWMKYWLNRLFK